MTAISIIGGGAAGMMAGAILAQVGRFDKTVAQAQIRLFEKNVYLGAKVLISGGGRCNVTTGIFDVREFLQNYPRGAKFLITAMYHFPPQKVIEWFELRGVSIKIEPDLRVFPASDNGKDVVGALEKEILLSSHARIFLKAHVISVEKIGDRFILKLADGRTFESDFLVITTGGNAYRMTGSTGDGYAFAKALGHTITPLTASLTSFKSAETWLHKLSGVSFEKCAFILRSCDGKRTYKRQGPFLFTHLGVSGPAIFALSAAGAYEHYDKQLPMKLWINFFPDENQEQLRQRFQHMLAKHVKKSVFNLLDMFLPKSLCHVIVDILKIKPEMSCGNLNKQQQLSILSSMQHFELNIIGRGAGDEFVTAGGVSLAEVDSRTMESKICPRLYFAGEILDVDGFTGGFNLQASWATGNLAGESIVQAVKF